MKISDIVKTGKVTISFELFPPKAGAPFALHEPPVSGGGRPLFRRADPPPCAPAGHARRAGADDADRKRIRKLRERP